VNPSALASLLHGGVSISKYHTVAEYAEALGALNGIAGAMLFEFARVGRGHRDTICGNFVARAITMSKSIFTLYDGDAYQDCWILHRCLMERLFHLEHLANTNSFDAYEEWSFVKQYKELRRVQEDIQFADAALDPAFHLTPDQVARAKSLKKRAPEWHRPRAEAVAKELQMHFLYRYGYEFASGHVHPMANDGLRDFYHITGLQPAPGFPNEIVVLSNTLLVSTMLIQSAMNASSLLWRRVVYDFVDAVREYLGDGGDAHKILFVKLGRALETGFQMAEAKPAG
jgi:hypothetical protein